MTKIEKINKIKELLNKGETVILHMSGYYAEDTEVLKWDSEDNILKVYSGNKDNVHDRTEYPSIDRYVKENNIGIAVNIFVKLE